MRQAELGAGSGVLPVGTVVFFRSDVEGSMALVRSLGARYDELNAAHHSILQTTISARGGQIVRTEGDAVFAVFPDARAAADAAVAAQRDMLAFEWPVDAQLKVRIGLHAGAAHRAGDDYGGFEVNRSARIADLGWGGQIIVSAPTRSLLVTDMADDWSIKDLGRHRLKGIVEPEEIYQLQAAGLATDFPPPRSGSTATDHLPERMTSLVGREQELEELRTLLEGTRLLTLAGPGGSGKTTLAIELGRRHASSFGDGAWLADMQAIRDTTEVRGAIAHALGLLDGSAGTAGDRLLPYVASRELLIVVDNFEQVVSAAEAIGEILQASPRTRVIVTSRIPLRLSAEQVYPVLPLRLRPAGEDEPSEAERLFIDRARQVRPGLGLDEEREIVRDICALVDGLPLAIELVAGGVAAMPVAAIRDRLAAHLPLPGQGRRDLPGRQATIEATVAWSHELLDPPLQKLFARLGVFEESFELEQVEAVCGPASDLGTEVLDGLVALVDHSLVHRVEDSIGGIRFGMLETIRSHARGLLQASAEWDDICARHTRAFVRLVERDWPVQPPIEAARLTDRVEPDDLNVRMGVARAIEAGDVELSLRTVGLLWRTWLSLGRLMAGRELIGAALSMSGAEAPSRARVMALDAAGGSAYWSGDLAVAMAFYEEQLAVAEMIDDDAGVAVAGVNLYFCRWFSGDADGAQHALTLSRRIIEAHDLRWGRAMLDIIQYLPLSALRFSAPESVPPDLEAAALHLESMEDPIYRPMALLLRSELSRLAGDLRGSARMLAASVRACLAQRLPADAALYLVAWPAEVLAAGVPEAAATVHAASVAAFERLGIRAPMDPAKQGWQDPTAALIDMLGQDRFEAAVAVGRRMSLAQVTDYIEQVSDELPREPL